MFGSGQVEACVHFVQILVVNAKSEQVSCSLYYDRMAIINRIRFLDDSRVQHLIDG